MILAISPHLDDVVFSAGGYLYQQSRAGERVHCITVFTRSVPNPTGFALACQLDKGLAGEVDYMDLRRAEDRDAFAILGGSVEHWEYPEAPHRGYESAPELFAGLKPMDSLDVAQLHRDLRDSITRLRPAELLYPFGAGNHVDHLQVIDAIELLRSVFPQVRFRQYYDMPYARKFRHLYPELDTTLMGTVMTDEARRVKMRACAAYRTQVGFQFGNREDMSVMLGNREYFVDFPGAM